MTQLNVNDARCEALFASGLQRSDAPTHEALAEVISRTVRQFGIAGCRSRMAQEFGDHPEAAASRMRWIRQLVSGIYAPAASRSARPGGWPPAQGSGQRAVRPTAGRPTAPPDTSGPRSPTVWRRISDPALPVVVCGHSLGGALATLLVADLTANTPLKPQAWTFASPRTGDAIFAARYGGLSTVSWRIYNQVNVVPYFPVDVTDNYQPVTTGYAINSLGKAKWSLGCAHALNTYMHVLSPATVPLDPACS